MCLFVDFHSEETKRERERGQSIHFIHKIVAENHLNSNSTVNRIF